MEKNKKGCPNCGAINYKHIKAEGEVVCQVCGCVIAEKTVGQLGRGTRKGSGGAFRGHPFA